jgi:hypothetical protein
MAWIYGCLNKTISLQISFSIVKMSRTPGRHLHPSNLPCAASLRFEAQQQPRLHIAAGYYATSNPPSNIDNITVVSSFILGIITLFKCSEYYDCYLPTRFFMYFLSVTSTLSSQPSTCALAVCLWMQYIISMYSSYSSYLVYSPKHLMLAVKLCCLGCTRFRINITVHETSIVVYSHALVLWLSHSWRLLLVSKLSFFLLNRKHYILQPYCSLMAVAIIVKFIFENSWSSPLGYEEL